MYPEALTWDLHICPLCGLPNIDGVVVDCLNKSATNAGNAHDCWAHQHCIEAAGAPSPRSRTQE